MNNSTELGGTPPPYGVPPQRGGSDNKGLVTVLWVLVALIAVGIVAALVVFFMNQGKAKEDELKAQMEQLQAQKDSLRNVASAEQHRADSIAAANAKSVAAAKANAAAKNAAAANNRRVQSSGNIPYGSTGPWHIRDLSGYTNIRNRPNGTVCMRLYSHVQYTIYTAEEVDGWLRMTYCYNEKQGYQVNFHSSSTGTYWIHRSVLY